MNYIHVFDIIQSLYVKKSSKVVHVSTVAIVLRIHTITSVSTSALDVTLFINAWKNQMLIVNSSYTT